MVHFTLTFLTLFFGLGLAGKRLAHHQTCISNKECKSQSCISLCDSSQGTCVEPKWFFERHSMAVPDCVERDIEGNLIYKGLRNKDARELGETCAISYNCVSGNCVPECGARRGAWRCIQHKSFFESYGIDHPTCIHEKLFSLMKKLEIGNEEEKQDAINSIKRLDGVPLQNLEIKINASEQEKEKNQYPVEENVSQVSMSTTSYESDRQSLDYNSNLNEGQNIVTNEGLESFNSNENVQSIEQSEIIVTNNYNSIDDKMFNTDNGNFHQDSVLDNENHFETSNDDIERISSLNNVAPVIDTINEIASKTINARNTFPEAHNLNNNVVDVAHETLSDISFVQMNDREATEENMLNSNPTESNSLEKNEIPEASYISFETKINEIEGSHHPETQPSFSFAESNSETTQTEADGQISNYEFPQYLRNQNTMESVKEVENTFETEINDVGRVQNFENPNSQNVPEAQSSIYLTDTNSEENIDEAAQLPNREIPDYLAESNSETSQTEAVGQISSNEYPQYLRNQNSMESLKEVENTFETEMNDGEGGVQNFENPNSQNVPETQSSTSLADTNSEDNTDEAVQIPNRAIPDYLRKTPQLLRTGSESNMLERLIDGF